MAKCLVDYTNYEPIQFKKENSIITLDGGVVPIFTLVAYAEAFAEQRGFVNALLNFRTLRKQIEAQVALQLVEKNGTNATPSDGTNSGPDGSRDLHSMENRQSVVCAAE